MPPAEGQIDGAVQFSMPIPHGHRPEGAVSVMMTRIEEDGLVFVHASDHQFHHEGSIEQILALKPDIVLTSGPALYLGNLSKVQLQNAKRNAIRLSKNVGTLIIDHHVLRSENGLDWIDDIALETGNRVVCAAEFMCGSPLLLEAWRVLLYEKMPVPEGWHEDYAAGLVNVGEYLNQGWDVMGEKAGKSQP